MLYDLVIPLIIGLAVFLFGMKVMELALYRWAGPYVSVVLRKFTSTPFRGLMTGTGITALLQSSSAVTVITIGFVNAGIMTFPQTLGIILGSNIGSCLTTELIGLEIKIPSVQLLLVSSLTAICFWLLPQKSSDSDSTGARIMHAGKWLTLSIAGFACVLLGVDIMKTIVPALQSHGLYGWFIAKSQHSVYWAVLAGAVVTALIHSSAATVAIAMGLASVSALPVDVGIAMILGANIGTCVTGLLASLGGSRFGRNVAWSHIMLNVGGALLFLPFLHLLHQGAAMLSPQPAGQLAHAQTIFNVVCSVIALPLCYLPALKLDAKP